jgi:NDP-sugar pyrophosphorylase family protein
MKAMVLAAGLGTRLRPLTNDRPKALAEVAGRTLLEIVLTRLKAFGVNEVIVNVHHFADMVVEYLARQNFGMRIEISREEELLDTGGGLKKAAWFFQEGSSGNDEPFLLHNVDVISTIDLSRMVKSHRSSRALATLAVQDRETSRYLLFNDNGELCGRRAGRDGAVESGRAASRTTALAFSGVHVVSRRLLGMLSGGWGVFHCELLSATGGAGEKILAFRADEYYWRIWGRWRCKLAGEEAGRWEKVTHQDLR